MTKARTGSNHDTLKNLDHMRLGTFLLREEEHAALRRIALREHVSMAVVVRRLIDEKYGLDFVDISL